MHPLISMEVCFMNTVVMFNLLCFKYVFVIGGIFWAVIKKSLCVDYLNFKISFNVWQRVYSVSKC